MLLGNDTPHSCVARPEVQQQNSRDTLADALRPAGGRGLKSDSWIGFSARSLGLVPLNKRKYIQFVWEHSALRVLGM